MMSELHEVFPYLKADAQARVKALLVHIISTFGTPELTKSENPVMSTIVQELYKY